MRLFSKDGQHSIVVDPFGGQVLSWQFRDEHIFFPQQVVAVKSNGSVEYKTRGGMFICFPHFGPAINSGNYSMPQHGVIRDRVFETHFSTKSSALLRERIQYSPGCYNVFVEILYQVLDTGFSVRVLIHNGSHEDRHPIPFNFAFHPYFAIADDWRKIKYAHVEGDRRRGFNSIDIEKCPGEECHGGVKRKISIDTFNRKQTSGTFSIKISQKRKIYMITDGLENGIRMIIKYQKYLLWSDNYERYFCVEPYLEEPDTYGTKKGLWLPPKKEARFSLFFELAGK